MTLARPFRTEPANGPSLGVSVLVRRAGEVLLVRRARAPYAGRWALPGGHVRFGERLEDAAQRELAEETGIAARSFRQIETIEIFGSGREGGPATHHVLVVLAGEWESGEPIAGDDAAAAGWFDRGALAALDLTPESERLLAALAAGDEAAP
ncbi:MAG: NUDIX domain-containing protein [Bauldia sp.]